MRSQLGAVCIKHDGNQMSVAVTVYIVLYRSLVIIAVNQEYMSNDWQALLELESWNHCH